MQKIDSMCGSVAAIENGFMQQEIAQAAYQAQQKTESGKQIVVGVNKFVQEEKKQPATFRVEDSIRELQIQKLKKLKQERDNQKFSDAIQRMEQGIVQNENAMPYVIAAVENYATLGEIADSFRKAYGEYK